MSEIGHNLATIKAQIEAAAGLCGRDADSIRLVAVSKRQPLEAIQAAWEAGQRDFGENYVQEALEKIEAFHPQGIHWHYIGPIQSNKTRAISTHFDWVHSVDRLKIAQRLAEQRPSGLAPLQICLQVNISGEQSKSGVTPDELAPLAQAVASLPHITLRGLMALPARASGIEQQRPAFRQLRELLDMLRDEGLDLDTLSMGTSADMEAAIIEGATQVRIGTALFGARR